ncbi:dihydroneopterin aldolase [Candidatus Kinetoplastibacterium oncopeltii TCC290E]|uniref:dihydroneopterin aldolase n=1 Tax=Candidatus Kinetoplastidibacterium stringomonadis TCC290E TaxID=1208920 RepID=M1M7Q5_9PROT|nr:dihydroneopterin aldolase [Candidatus Kinetoplastibacterium oncopeltii]AGF48075.1 dihydroneopterin aldolase [Candidatus Kinetoplastibacterium oncopeltii TCC290E]
MKFSRKILIHDLIIESSVGILEREINNKQQIKIAAILKLESSDTNIDDIKHVLDYRQVVEIITKITTSKHFGLIETLSYNISDELMNTFPEIISLKMTITKFNVFSNCKNISIEEKYYR